MDIKNIMNKLYIIIFLFIIILVLKFIVNFIIYEENILDRNSKSSLEEDGFVLFKNILSHKEIKYLTNLCNEDKHKEAKHYLIYNKKIQNLVKKQITLEYVFQDYIFVIKRSAIHTCHRDSNGDFFNDNQKHPSYTILFFLEDMEKCLGVIPKSHHDINSFNYNHNDEVQNVICQKGDGILFNANLIHVGALNSKEDNLRIQMKITHKDDIETISFYNNYNKILDQDNNMPFFLKKAQRKLSCMFPIFSNFTQTEIQQTASGKEISISQRIFSYLFYGNTDFYNLKNA